MTDEGEVGFQGPGPFHLPVVQDATATGHKDNDVTMTLRALLPKRGTELESVSAQMVSSIARKLAADLIRAADMADGHRE